MSQTKVQLIDGFDIDTSVPDDSLVIDSSGTLTLTSDAATTPLIVNIDTAEAFRIDSSSRLLVGTSSSLDLDAPIQVASTVYGIESFRFSTSATGAGGAIDLARSNSDTVGITSAITNGQGLGVVRFRGAGSSNTYLTGAEIEATSDGGTVSASSMPTRLVFSTTADGNSSPTERTRISNDGFFNHFTDTSFNVRTARTSGVNFAFSVSNNASSTSTGNNVLIVRADGDVENDNNSYGPISSDERLKQDIVDAGSQWDDIKGVRLTKFRYKKDPTGELQLGPIAQELEQVSPRLITRRPASEDEIADPSNSLVDGDEVLSFKASILYMKAVGALQEAMERIETLEASNTDLLARVSALESA